ncbi:hypothetical protein JCM19037_2057 [Geomicrobium sp. JCM 19037]|nr:hypothetical protein JCM19037_2057 [Geomicrobium sp. JCM 19037]
MYPERVRAKMYRIIDDSEVLLIRKQTRIQLGEGKAVIGIVLMTNPGSFKCGNTEEWQLFQAGEGLNDHYEGENFPDMTMQCVIEVIRKGTSAQGVHRVDKFTSIIFQMLFRVKPRKRSTNTNVLKR